MSDNTIPGCLDDYGNPTFGNGPCNCCEWKETCQKATIMRQKLKKLQGAGSQ